MLFNKYRKRLLVKRFGGVFMLKKLIYFIVFILCFISITFLNTSRVQAENGIEEIKKNAKEYLYEGQYQDSEREFKKALELAPEDVEVLMGLGAIYHTQGKYDDAITMYTKITKINQKSTSALNNLADAYLRKGDFEKAEEYVLKALAINPDMPAAKATLGEIYLIKGFDDIALKQFEGALQNLEKEKDPKLKEYIKGYIQNKITEIKEKNSSAQSAQSE